MNSFIAELRRRNVFNVIAGYAVVSWLLMQLAGVLETSLHLPTWFDTMVTVLVLIGFPIAVALSWILQFSPQGITRTLKNPEISDATHSKNTIIIFSVSGLITIALIALMWQHLKNTNVIDENLDDVARAKEQTTEQTATSTDVDKNLSLATQSIAVLPFEDFSASEDQSYFGRGISEELLNVLSRVKGLRVVSRTSSFAFTNKSLTVNDIAEALKVAHVLEGSVRKSGNTIRITAQLINAQSDQHIWSQTYDRSLSAENLFAVQDEISSAIVKQLKGKLTIVPLGAADKTLSLEAYELYLEAREYQELRTPESLALAAKGFTSVIDLDPSFAHAFSGLAETYLLMEEYAGLDAKTSQEKAAPMVNRALELAPNSAEVLTSAAHFTAQQANPASMIVAEEYARKAIEVNDNFARAHFKLGSILWEQGRTEEAIASYKKARALDPLSTGVLQNLARIYLSIGDQINAKSIGEDLIRLHPSLPFGYLVLTDVALNNGQYSKAHAFSQDAYALNQQSSSVKRNLRRIYNAAGLYKNVLWYEDSPTSQVWYAIYSNDMELVARELPKVKEMTELAWFLYHLRDYEKTNQIVSAYIDAYKLLDRPINDISTATYIIALAQTQKALGVDNQQALGLLDDYFTDERPEAISNSRELEQRVLFSVLRGQYERSYVWIDRILDLGYILPFVNPIYDDIKQSSEFQLRQKRMQGLKEQTKQEIILQLEQAKPEWIVPKGE